MIIDTHGHMSPKGNKEMTRNNKLALLGGLKAVKTDPGEMFNWPIITKTL